MTPRHYNQNPWMGDAYRRLQRRSTESARREHEMSHAAINLANGLRNMLVGRPAGYEAPYELRMTETGAWCSTAVSSQAQSARCLFCRKQFAAWGKRRHKNGRAGGNWPKPLTEGYNNHVEPCASAWLVLQVARHATEQMTDVEARAFGAWRASHAQPRNQGHDIYSTLPHEFADLFDHLPVPPSHPFAMDLEVALIALTRVWSPA